MPNVPAGVVVEQQSAPVQWHAPPSTIRGTVTAAALIALAALAVYANSFQGVFVFDDEGSIKDNPTIHHLGSLRDVLSPPPNRETVSGRITVSGRPLLNLSLAVNYAIGGLNPGGYHAVNLAIHIVTALLLFGTLRRTLAGRRLRHRFAAAATPLALAITLLRTVHPLQTEAVTYVVQRAESQMAMFYLLVLYCVIRGAEKPFLWYALAIAACWLGVATKEIMASAPLVVLLYDRLFLSDSWSEVWRRRWGLYLGLATAWGLLAYLVLSSAMLTAPVVRGVMMTPWSYACTEPGVILHYLRLAFWPHPLCLDYRWPVARHWSQIVPGLLVVGAIAAATLWGLWQCKPWTLLGAWFLLIGAHVEYPPFGRPGLRAPHVFAPGGRGDGRRAGRLRSRPVALNRGTIRPRCLCLAGGSMVIAVSVALGVVAAVRNADYHSELSIWQDAILTASGNDRAHYNLGNVMVHAGMKDQAISEYERALQINPNYAEAHNNLGLVLIREGTLERAIAHCRKALDIEPVYPEARNNLALAFVQLGRLDEAIAECRTALKEDPKYPEAQVNFGNALLRQGRPEEAIEHYQRALEIRPDFAEAHNNLGDVLRQLGRTNEAVAHCRKALELDPRYAEAHLNLGNACCNRESQRRRWPNTSRPWRLAPISGWLTRTWACSSTRGERFARRSRTGASSSGCNPIPSPF